MSVEIIFGIEEVDREDAARLLWFAFENKLGFLLGRDERALAYLAAGIVPSHFIGAYEDGNLLGILGLDLGKGSAFSDNFSDLWEIYGLSAPFRAFGLSLFSRRPNPEMAYIEAAAVEANHQGRGIGSQLLNCAKNAAKRAEFASLALEVLTENQKAIALYEREGFEFRHRQHIGFLGRLINVHSIDFMEYKIL